MLQIVKYFIFSIIFMCIFFTSCKEATLEERLAATNGTNFSIKRFIYNQWKANAGKPFVILKTIKIDGKVDSSYSNSDTLNWNEIFDVFYETDISDKKYVGHYKFNQIEDKEDQTINLMLDASEDDFFVRKFMLSIDMNTEKVRGIYIETFKHSALGEVQQKLYYAPMRTVQIQTYEDPLIGTKKNKIVQYYFL